RQRPDAPRSAARGQEARGAVGYREGLRLLRARGRDPSRSAGTPVAGPHLAHRQRRAAPGIGPEHDGVGRPAHHRGTLAALRAQAGRSHLHRHAPVRAPHTPEFRAVNPEGLIPVVADGDLTIPQSLAIIEYLEETHPDPPLLPRPAADRAQVRSLALAVACDIHPLGNTRVLS